MLLNSGEYSTDNTGLILGLVLVGFVLFVLWMAFGPRGKD